MEDTNLLTKIWGPGTWVALHSISFGYPDNPSSKDKESYFEFFRLLGDVLPCSYCRDSYKKFIETGITRLDEQTMDNRLSLTKWLYNVHEAVNNKLGVDYGVTYDDLVKRYSSYKAFCGIRQDPSKLGCVGPVEAIKNSYEIASVKECPIIPYKIARVFKKYAKLRGVSDEEIQNADSIIDHCNNDDSTWKKRNRECCDIIYNMRLHGIPPLELEGKWKGLPTIEETRLLMRLSSNLSRSELHDIVKKIPECKDEFDKIYCLPRSNSR